MPSRKLRTVPPFSLPRWRPRKTMAERALIASIARSRWKINGRHTCSDAHETSRIARFASQKIEHCIVYRCSAKMCRGATAQPVATLSCTKSFADAITRFIWPTYTSLPRPSLRGGSALTWNSCAHSSPPLLG